MSNNFWSDEYECEITVMRDTPYVKGGQHTGRTESGVRVRITCVNSSYTLIDVSVRNRSQHQSRHLAMTMAEYAYLEMKL